MIPTTLSFDPSRCRCRHNGRRPTVGIRGFASGFATAVGGLLLSLGFFLRIWATFYFYEHRMKVISLEPQKALITSGPYGFSRNPLYLGGNVFIFFWAALLFGSPAAPVLN